MGLLMSDTMLIDPMLDDTAWLRASLGAWVYELDTWLDLYHSEAAERLSKTSQGLGLVPRPLALVLSLGKLLGRL